MPAGFPRPAPGPLLVLNIDGSHGTTPGSLASARQVWDDAYDRSAIIVPVGWVSPDGNRLVVLTVTAGADEDDAYDRSRVPGHPYSITITLDPARDV